MVDDGYTFKNYEKLQKYKLDVEGLLSQKSPIEIVHEEKERERIEKEE